MLIDNLINELVNYKDLIFDLDDTIYEKKLFDIGAYEDIEKYFLSKTIVDLTGMAIFLNLTRKKKGNDYKNLFDDAALKYNLSNVSVKKMIDLYRNHNCKYVKYNQSLMPYLIDNLKTYQRIFIVSNGYKKTQKRKICKLKINYFSTGIVICNPEKPEQLKPSNWAFNVLDKKFFLKTPVIIGDREDIDGEFASNSGVPFIKYKYGE